MLNFYVKQIYMQPTIVFWRNGVHAFPETLCKSLKSMDSVYLYNQFATVKTNPSIFYLICTDYNLVFLS
jgi:hypothetical protein